MDSVHMCGSQDILSKKSNKNKRWWWWWRIFRDLMNMGINTQTSSSSWCSVGTDAARVVSLRIQNQNFSPNAMPMLEDMVKDLWTGEFILNLPDQMCGEIVWEIILYEKEDHLDKAASCWLCIIYDGVHNVGWQKWRALRRDTPDFALSGKAQKMENRGMKEKRERGQSMNKNASNAKRCKRS